MDGELLSNLEELRKKALELEENVSRMEQKVIHFPLSGMKHLASVEEKQNGVNQILTNFKMIQGQLMTLRSQYTSFCKSVFYISQGLDSILNCEGIRAKAEQRWHRLLDLVISLEEGVWAELVQSGIQASQFSKKLVYLVEYWKKEDASGFCLEVNTSGHSLKSTSSSMDFGRDISEAVNKVVKDHHQQQRKKEPHLQSSLGSDVAITYTSEVVASLPRPRVQNKSGSESESFKPESAIPQRGVNQSPNHYQLRNGFVSDQKRNNPVLSTSEKSCQTVINSPKSISLTSSGCLNIACRHCNCLIELPLNQVQSLLPSLATFQPLVSSLEANENPNKPYLRVEKVTPVPVFNHAGLGQTKSNDTNHVVHQSGTQNAIGCRSHDSLNTSTQSVQSGFSISEKDESSRHRLHREYLKQIKGGYKSVQELFREIDKNIRDSLNDSKSESVGRESHKTTNPIEIKSNPVHENNPPANTEPNQENCSTCVKSESKFPSKANTQYLKTDQPREKEQLDLSKQSIISREGKTQSVDEKHPMFSSVNQSRSAVVADNVHRLSNQSTHEIVPKEAPMRSSTPKPEAKIDPSDNTTLTTEVGEKSEFQKVEGSWKPLKNAADSGFNNESKLTEANATAFSELDYLAPQEVYISSFRLKMQPPVAVSKDQPTDTTD